MTAHYSDVASGTTLDRPGLKEALLGARRGEYDILLVHRLDRLARSIQALYELLRKLDHFEVDVHSATEPFDNTSPMGRLLRSFLGMFAAVEREAIIERVTRGLATKAARGEWPSGVPPFGYDVREVDSRKHVLFPNDDAETVRLIFRLYVEDALGASGIRELLNEWGYQYTPTRPGAI